MLKIKKKTVSLKEVPKQRKDSEGNAKYKSLSDDYTPEFEPQRILVREYKTQGGDDVKQYLVGKVQRFADLGLPYVFLQLYKESAKYTGFEKGKTVYFPLEMLYDVQDLLTSISETCDRLKIE